MTTIINQLSRSPYRALVPIREENIRAALGVIAELPTFSEEVERLKLEVAGENYFDIQMEFSQLQMALDGFITYDIAAGTPNAKMYNFTYTKHALTQAVSRIRPEGVVGMAGYLAACPPELRSLNFNYWHAEFFGDADTQTKGNRVTLRVKDGEFNTKFLRAVVSQSYVPIDDVPVLQSLSSLIPGGAHLRSVRGDIRSRFDAIWPSNQREIRPGDALFVALRLINSETGASSVRLEPMVYHASSSAYFIIPRAGEDVAIRHIGEARDRLKLAFKHVMAQIDPFVEMLRESYDDSIQEHFKDIEQMWECLGKHYGISELMVALIKHAAQPFIPTDRLGVAQAMIKAANDMDLDAAEEVQRAAGLLVMNGWSPLYRHI